MHWIRPQAASYVATAWIAVALVSGSGCVGLLAQGLYMFKGNTIPAAFDGLEGKRVAVVCVAGTSSLGPDTTAEMLSRAVGSLLRQKVKKIDVVHYDEVADWIDNNGWNELDYRQIGRGVKADMVLGIDLDSFGLHEGQTLFKGQATVTSTVYDMTAEGKVIYRAAANEFVFPDNGAIHTTETNESAFRRSFVRVLAQHIARQFYAYEFKDDFGRDADSVLGMRR